MKKLNFDALTQFEVPADWVEKALCAKPKKKPLWLRPAFVGSAALPVIAAAVALTLWLHTGGNAPLFHKTELPVQSAATAAETESTLPTELLPQTSPSKAVNSTRPDGSSPTASAAQAVTQAAPATQPTVTPGTQPTRAVQPVASEKPTQPDPTTPTAPVQPTKTVEPTEPTLPPLQITDMEYLAEPIDVGGSDDPTVAQAPLGEWIILSFYNRFDSDEPIFCHISYRGTAVTSLYSDRERMTVSDRQWCMATFSAPSYFAELPYGTALEFIFYNSEGRAYRFSDVALTEDIAFELIEF